MTILPRTRRPAVTLTEVLVAMFVMALGLISLLTLFPLGAIQIGVALRDDRTAQTASQADAFLRAYWQARVVEGGAHPPEPFVWAMDDPNQVMQRSPTGTELNTPRELVVNQFVAASYVTSGTNLPTSPNSTNPKNTGQILSDISLAAETYLVAPSTKPTVPDTTLGTGQAYYAVPPTGQAAGAVSPSYPVFVDPLNFRVKSGGDQTWVAWSNGSSTLQPPMPRRTLGTLTSGAALDILRTTNLLDDLTFDTNGTALREAGTLITRQGRYNWSAVLQRPQNGTRNVANLTILVYDGRPPLIDLGKDTEVAVSPASALVAGQTSVDVTVPTPTDPTAPPIVRKGGWFMDGTLQSGPTGVRNAHFYRIVGLTDNGGGSFTLDIEPPIRVASPSGSTSTLYFFAGLAEVFVRPPLTPITAP